jgi:hypothetical protein
MAARESQSDKWPMAAIVAANKVVAMRMSRDAMMMEAILYESMQGRTEGALSRIARIK